MFLLSITYTQPFEEVQKYMDGHRSFLKENLDSGIFIMYGRKLPGPGGLLLCRTNNRQEVDELIATDPFVKANVASYEITWFMPMGWCDELAGFFGNSPSKKSD